MIARAYESPADLRRMQELVAELWRQRGPAVHTHVGDLAWGRFQHAGREPEWKTQLWEEAGQVVAYTWLRKPGAMEFELHPDHPELLDEVLAWLEAAAPDETLRTYALSIDTELRARLEERGWSVNEEATPLAHHVRALEPEPPLPELPPGFRLRTVEPADLERRVEIHRAAWEPSRVTAESYTNVMAAWPYRAELDCVVEAPDGSFAASCLAWLDDLNRVGELEPVGTHPQRRRLGLASAVCRFALRRLREEGAETAIVYAYVDPENNPGPKLLYESIGFREHARSLELTKARTGR